MFNKVINIILLFTIFLIKGDAFLAAYNFDDVQFSLIDVHDYNAQEFSSEEEENQEAEKSDTDEFIEEAELSLPFLISNKMVVAKLIQNLILHKSSLPNPPPEIA